ncbi:MAG: chorismate mutase [Erysipelotrichaceae bacterium]|nr:chorismate mutase [Erysipelotrichaceae bacterium]
MNKLENARLTIEEIDKQFTELFEKRFEAVKDVIEYKKENNIPIFDEKREAYLLAKNLGYIKNDSLKKYYEDFLLNMFRISKEYQKDLL